MTRRHYYFIINMRLRMKLKITMVITALILSRCSQSATAQGNLVVNGGFDTDASGWTATNVDNGGGGYRSNKGNPGGYFILFGFPPAITPTISEIINGLIPGDVYTVSGDYNFIISPGTGSPTNLSFGVAIDGFGLFEAAGSADSNWQSFNFLYTATSSNVVLSLFSQLNGPGVGCGIDNIAMEAVPEPNSLWLVGIGGIVSALYIKKRRKHPDA
jgi:hypothetical protein